MDDDELAYCQECEWIGEWDALVAGFKDPVARHCPDCGGSEVDEQATLHNGHYAK